MRVPFTAGADDDDRRFETVLRKFLPHQSLGAIHKALRRGDIRLNGVKANPESRVSSGDQIEIWDRLVPAAGRERSTTDSLDPTWIVYETQDLLVINKPSGILVHRGDAVSGTEPLLDELVRAWWSPKAPASLGFRPGPLHRLDRETSGLIVFSKTLAGARLFTQALAARTMTKTYLAVLTGELTGPRTVQLPLARDTQTRTTRLDHDGLAAESGFLPLAWAPGLTLAQVDLGSGRTHQIRAHAQALGHPLAGDAKYGGGSTPSGLDVPWLLHAWKLAGPVLPPLSASLSPDRQTWLKKVFKFSFESTDTDR